MPKPQAANSSDLIDALHDGANAFRRHDVKPVPSRNKWHLASALQKAIRRGHVELAQSYASGLLEHHPGYVFRRLGVIALEDIGPGDWLACALALEALTCSRLRRKLGERPVLLSLVTALSTAPKSRALADKANVDAASTALADESNGLRADSPFIVQSIARSAKNLEGLGRGVFAIWQATQAPTAVVCHPPDHFGDELVGGYVAAAFDKHTHEGLRAIATLAGPFSARQLGLVLFYKEGCHVDRQLTWACGEALRARSHGIDYLTKYGFASLDHVQACELFVRQRRGQLNVARRRIAG